MKNSKMISSLIFDKSYFSKQRDTQKGDGMKEEWGLGVLKIILNFSVQ